MERFGVVCVVLVLAGCACSARAAPAGGCTTVDNAVLSGDVNPASD